MRTAIFIPAYQAEGTLDRVVSCIPEEVRNAVERIYIQDDASTDRTWVVALDLVRRYGNVTAARNESNLGYGGTKKKAYKQLIREGFDLVVMLHGDGQYSPRDLPQMIAPIAAGQADIVLGSRVLGDPLGGGMPIYKFVGNVMLTAILNWSLGLRLTDYHTGYRAYSVDALRQLDLESCANGHGISAEVIVRAARRGLRIVAVPVATSYGPGSRSITLWTSIRYGYSVLRLVTSSQKQQV